MDEPRGSRWDGGSLECGIDMSLVDCGRMKGWSRGWVVGWAPGESVGLLDDYFPTWTGVMKPILTLS